jgi:methionyl aminopeptidase
MITIKNKSAIYKMEGAGALLHDIFDRIEPLLEPGVTTLELDTWIASQLKKSGLCTRMHGYMGYKHVSCISVNDEVVHGVPRRDGFLKAGDVVKVDVCASWKGYCADMARSFIVGSVAKPEVQKFLAVAQASLDAGIKQARAGNYLSDISAAIQKEVEAHGFGVVRDFAGHGIGKQMHEDPEILNYGEPGKGPRLQPGMAFALEPMITMGHYEVYVCDDRWTVKTQDGSLAAHVEDTIVVTEHEPKIITRLKQAV